MNNFITLHTKLINTDLEKLGIGEEQQAGTVVSIMVNLVLLESFFPYPDDNSATGFSGSKLNFMSGKETLVVEDYEEVTRIIDDVLRSAGFSDAKQRVLTMGGWEQFRIPNIFPNEGV